MNVLQLILYVVGCSLMVIVISLILESVERRFVARLQNRLGPCYTGLRGFIQSVWDVLKLVFRGWFMLKEADTVLIPCIALSLSFSLLGSLLIPWFGFTPLGMDYDLLIILACLTISTAFMLIASIAFRSPYSTLGAVRETSLLLSYELGLLALIAVPYSITGHLNIAYVHNHILAYVVSHPLAILLWVLGLLLGLLLVLVECGKEPFHVGVAETEVAGGYLVEFSGPLLAAALISRKVYALVVIALYVSLFIPPPFEGLPHFIILLLEATGILLLIDLISASVPRLRAIDAVQLGWFVIAPLSMTLIALALGVARL